MPHPTRAHAFAPAGYRVQRRRRRRRCFERAAAARQPPPGVLEIRNSRSCRKARRLSNTPPRGNRPHAAAACHAAGGTGRSARAVICVLARRQLTAITLGEDSPSCAHLPAVADAVVNVRHIRSACVPGCRRERVRRAEPVQEQGGGGGRRGEGARGVGGGEQDSPPAAGGIGGRGGGGGGG